MAATKPITPYIDCLENRPIPLSLGWLGRIFVLGCLLTMAGASLTAYRLQAGEEADATLEQNVKILGENQKKMDEEGRITAQQVGLANKQLRLLLQLEGVTERVEPPKIEESKLKELE
jgi:hypothetical protein